MKKILNKYYNCDSKFHIFLQDQYHLIKIIVYTNRYKIYYTIFNIEFYEKFKDKYSYNNIWYGFTLQLPYVFTFNSQTHIIFNFRKTFVKIFEKEHSTKIINMDL